ncbi:MAG: zf-HC2 domain-containing protein [Acidimicrobiales bacterium]
MNNHPTSDLSSTQHLGPETISALIDGELAEAAAGQARAHLDDCQSCSALEARLRRVAQALDDLGSKAGGSSASSDRRAAAISAGLDAYDSTVALPAQAAARQHRARSRSLAVAAAGIAVLGAISVGILSLAHGGGPISGSATASRPLLHQATRAVPNAGKTTAQSPGFPALSIRQSSGIVSCQLSPQRPASRQPVLHEAGTAKCVKTGPGLIVLRAGVVLAYSTTTRSVTIDLSHELTLWHPAVMVVGTRVVGLATVTGARDRQLVVSDMTPQALKILEGALASSG